MYGYIYITTNILNNKTYIGKKKGVFDKSYYGSGVILQQSIKKYGKHNFTCNVLAYCFTEEELNKSEIYYIEKMKPVYNLARGGTGGDTLALSSNKHKERVIEKRAAGMKRNWSNLTDEQRVARGRAISEAKKGIASYRPGYKHSDKTRKKITKGLKRSNFHNTPEWRANHAAACAKRKGIPNKNCWKSVEYDGIIYSSMKEACEKLNMSFPTLKKLIKNDKARYI